MRAVVVSPSICDFYFTPGRAAALGSLSVHNLLLKEGIDSTFLNLPLLKPRGKKIPLPESHKYLEPYIINGEKGPVTYFNSFKRFGPNLEESYHLISSKNPDIVFISLFAWAYAQDAIELARKICERKYLDNKNRIICIGGAGVSVFPEFFKETNLFDYVLEGDAEVVIPSFICSAKKGQKDFKLVTGINYNEPEPILNMNVDSKGKQWISMILSRGCPLKCKFCSNHLTQGRSFRATSIDKLENKLDVLNICKDSPLHITLEDDNLLIRKNYFKEILIMIKRRYPKVSFSIDNGLDYTYLSQDFLLFLINIGFNSFTFSLGTFNQDILNNEERPSDFIKFEEILDVLKEFSIPVKTFLICGLPGDTTSTVLNSLKYLHSLNTDIGVSLFYTVPGLPRFENKELFLNKSSRLCCGSAAYPWAKSLTTRELITCFRLSRLSNFIKRKCKSSIEMELLEFIKKEKNIFTLKGKSNQVIEVNNLDNKITENFLNYVFN